MSETTRRAYRWTVLATIGTAVTATVVLLPASELPADAAGTAAAPAETFAFTGAPQTTVVPAGATQVDITVDGARGGHGLRAESAAGSGASITGTFAVTPGQTVTVDVGGRGGDIDSYNAPAGGAGGWGYGRGATGGVYNGGGGAGGGGGGASSVQVDTTLVAVAGGGGGAGGQGEFNDDAYGGGTGGSAGPSAGNGASGHGPNTKVCKGSGGGTGGGAATVDGTAGGRASSISVPGSGGGGGGGYRGGTGGGPGGLGGCGGSGGGAGSSWRAAALTPSTLATGTGAPDGSGNGRVTLTWFPVTPTITVAIDETTPQLGDLPTVTATLPSDVTGSVTFTVDGTTAIGTVPVRNGVAEVDLPTATIGVGHHVVSAEYHGDARHDAATSTPVAVDVLPADDTTGPTSIRRVTVGKYPIGVALAGSGGDVAVVSSDATNGVSLIDSRTGDVLRTVDLGADASPSEVAAAPDAPVAYVATQTGVAAVDLTTGAVTRPFGDSSAYNVEVSRDGQHIWSSSGANSEIDEFGPDGTFQQSLLVTGYDATEMSLSADGATLYVTATTIPDSNGDSTYALFAYDTASGTRRASTTLEFQSEATVSSPDGRTLYVASSGNFQQPVPKYDDRLLVLDTATLTTRSVVTVGTCPSSIAVTPDGRTAYVADNASSDVTAVDLTKVVVLDRVPVRPYPTTVALNDDGRNAWVTETGFGNRAGTTVAVLGTVAPAVTTEPVGLDVTAGIPVDLAAAASGAPTPVVQWQVSTDRLSWQDVPGATDGTFTFTPDRAGTTWYRAVFGNLAGRAVTEPARVHVTAVVGTVGATPPPPGSPASPDESLSTRGSSFRTLAATGPELDVLPLVAGGTGLLVAGAASLLAGRRRQPHPGSAVAAQAVPRL